MFRIMSNKGFHITFPNGITLSTQIGGGNYCDNYDFPIGKESQERGMESTTCELAIWDKKDAWITEQMCKEVFGKRDGNSVMVYVEFVKCLKVL